MVDITLKSKEAELTSEDFDQVIARYQTEIFKTIYYRVRSEDVARELTQVTFIQAYKSFTKLNKVRSIKSWLYKIALNKTNDYFRKQKLLFFLKSFDFRAENESTYIDNSPLDNLLQKEFWNRIDRFIDQLPNKEKEVFALRYLDNLTLKEIAEVQGKNENTVKTHLYRALKKYRQDTDLQDYLVEI